MATSTIKQDVLTYEEYKLSPFVFSRFGKLVVFRVWTDSAQAGASLGVLPERFRPKCPEYPYLIRAWSDSNTYCSIGSDGNVSIMNPTSGHWFVTCGAYVTA